MNIAAYFIQRRVTSWLVALLLGTALALGLQYDLGYIRVSYGHYLVETNAWIGLALFLTLVVASVFVLDLLRQFRRRSGDLIGWLARGSERRARHRTTKGLLALAEAAGLNPRYGCRMGICHQCSCRKTGGTVLNRLTGKPSGPGEETVQLCVSVPAGPVTLEL